MNNKISAKNRAILAETLIYLFGRRLKAISRLEKNPQYLEPIPVSKIHSRYNSGQAKLAINKAVDVWFKKEKRGNNITNQCSLFSVRSVARLSPEILMILQELYSDNLEHFKLLKASINSKDGTIVDVSTQFKFKDDTQAQMFIEVLDPLLQSTETKKDS